MILIANYIDKDQNKIGQMANEFMRDLAARGVPILETGNQGLNITTPHCYITFVTDVNKLRGRRFNAIYGRVPNEIRIYSISTLYKPRLNCGILDYVLMMEGI